MLRLANKRDARPRGLPMNSIRVKSRMQPTALSLKCSDLSSPLPPVLAKDAHVSASSLHRVGRWEMHANAAVIDTLVGSFEPAVRNLVLFGSLCSFLLRRDWARPVFVEQKKVKSTSLIFLCGRINKRSFRIWDSTRPEHHMQWHSAP